MSRCVDTETYSPSAIDTAPASVPASAVMRIVRVSAGATAATPTTRPWTQCRRWRRGPRRAAN